MAALWQELGPDGARAVVTRAVGEMAARLAEIGRGQAMDDMPAVLRAARRLSRTAGHVGMARIAQVANDVARCAGQNDQVALAAVLARLVRLCDRAVIDVDTAPGLSG